MKLRLAVSVALALALIALHTGASAQPWSSRERVAQVAHELSNTSADFAQIARDVEGYSAIAARAEALAREAEHFHQMVEQPTPYGHLLDDLAHLQQSFHEVRREFYRAHRAHHIPQVTSAWLRLVQFNELLLLTMGVEPETLGGPRAHQPSFPDRDHRGWHQREARPPWDYRDFR